MVGKYRGTSICYFAMQHLFLEKVLMAAKIAAYEMGIGGGLEKDLELQRCEPNICAFPRNPSTKSGVSWHAKKPHHFFLRESALPFMQRNGGGGLINDANPKLNFAFIS